MPRQLLFLQNLLANILWCEQGQGLTEYVLIIFLFAIALVGTVGAFGTTLQSLYSTVTTAIAAVAR